ncbi:MAG: hypothetical protein ABJH68_21710 [Ilumatobacter sp.]|uniref:hypothetical protein n=1 Tax=Ilumatobacter sp. TaxID=1967498 RepID=UPI00329871A7
MPLEEVPIARTAFDLLGSRAAKEADVWFSDGGTFGAGGGIDATVLIFDESVRSRLRGQSVFDGFELTVCPQLRPTSRSQRDRHR